MRIQSIPVQPVAHSLQAFIAEAKEKGLGMVIEQPGRPPRLENVSFKNLYKGTLVLGVVLKVSTYADSQSVNFRIIL